MSAAFTIPTAGTAGLGAAAEPPNSPSPASSPAPQTAATASAIRGRLIVRP
ncbi:hypothetical protein [Catenulispora yoronensis]|uniref:hypothetical protein n=1 Tax=Catenulispora yoronensis TaxID=450799 RepID=UPI0031D5851D